MKSQEISILKKKKVMPDEVIYLLGEINYTTFYLKNGGKITIAKTLKKLSEQFNVSNDFFRSHKSCIVNLNYISCIESSSLRLINNHSVLVSRRRKEHLGQNFNQLMSGN
ncbi:LytTR family transcriptional regulator [Lacihabitans sp. LS3-19]|uniref:LytR/AlgR family response regulator transcription factor n=1 Tax=Lacihabitans sp. LS3-19 TaxID=2487335 RepID=UPI0020CC45A7|nr:LytTR family DNA-binding domain-containing protein [Lacihabitans sp. LS3-19]MCP9766849.1 LytTR family transcriptional regulator [Lacihabitans sp. LS3-19]